MSWEILDKIRYLAFASVIFYFLFEHFDKKIVKDEREELIRLKTFELMHKLNLWSLTAIVVLIFFYPTMPAILPVMILVFTSLYGEIFGKLYYRRKY
jgi:hypothetical protein